MEKERIDIMVKTVNLCKSYKAFELKNININLEGGEILGLIGENGAGKTTIIKALMGIINITSGDVSVLGENPHNVQIKEHIGIVFDACPFYENFKAKEINTIMSSAYKTWDESKYFDILKLFKIDTGKKIKEFSHGMKMKLQIAVAMSHDIKLLILDEATNGLDPLAKDSFWDLILKFTREEGNSVIISSHIISDIEKMCDSVCLIHDGEIILSAYKDELLENYAVLKCTKGKFEEVDKNKVIGYRKSDFGVDALVLRKDFKNESLEKISLEDMFLYMVKKDN